MKYIEFQNEKISALGFGTMRFPLKEDHSVDEELTEKLIGYAYENGVNYFDTAFPYLDGKSEGITARCLAKYPRETYFLADKMPGHQFIKNIDPKKIFETQLQRLGTDYIDFYLLHNVNDSCLDTYMDENLGMIRYLLEEKKKGRIRHLGFSAHATPGRLKEFLEYCRKHDYRMEFCQLQVNYLDWTLQHAEEKIELLKSYNIPVWVMEPCRGGKLAALSPENHDRLNGEASGRSDASFAFRFLIKHISDGVILSGMNSMDQVVDNINTFNEYLPVTEEEEMVLFEIAEGMKKSVPCTGCRYCIDGCPMGIDIPYMMDLYNEYSFESSIGPATLIASVPVEKRPHACIGCGACADRCPQHIDIPEKMKKLAEMVDAGIDWREMCRKRNELAKM